MRDDDVLASARRFLDDADGTESSTSSRGDAALEATTRSLEDALGDLIETAERTLYIETPAFVARSAEGTPFRVFAGLLGSASVLKYHLSNV